MDSEVLQGVSRKCISKKLSWRQKISIFDIIAFLKILPKWTICLPHRIAQVCTAWCTFELTEPETQECNKEKFLFFFVSQGWGFHRLLGISLERFNLFENIPSKGNLPDYNHPLYHDSIYSIPPLGLSLG